MQQIGDWLKKLGMSEYAPRFAENRIDLSVLSQSFGNARGHGLRDKTTIQYDRHQRLRRELSMRYPDLDFRILASHGGQHLRFKAGEVIFHSGEQGRVFYVIQTGTVEIRRGTKLLERLTRGDIFGEMAIIDQSPRAADAIAATDLAVFSVDENRFLALIVEMPYFGLSVMRILTSRLRAATIA